MVHFYHRRSIHEIERMEYYRLITQADGSHIVEYEWATSDRYGAEIDSGRTHIPVAEFIAGDHAEDAKAALASYLNSAPKSLISE
jgi:hypothetical protein